MKKTLLLGLIVFLSIGHIKADNTEYSIKADSTAYSNEIQDTFFGVKFGTSKEEVKATLLSRGFEIVSDGLDAMLVEHDGNIRFGGYSWEYMLVQFVNNRFESISFVITLDDRNSKLKLTTKDVSSIFTPILSDLSKKYNMSIRDLKGTFTYRADSEQKFVALSWFVEKKAIMLVYGDKTLGDNSDQF